MEGNPLPMRDDTGSSFRVFVSHAKADAPDGAPEEKSIVRGFVELLISMGIKPESIFCTSLDDHTIPPGKTFLPYIGTELLKADLVFALISQNFYKSPFCWCEMGGAWANSKDLIPILIPPMNVEDASRGAIGNLHFININQKSQIMNLLKRLESDFRIKPPILNRFIERHEKFQKDIQSILKTSSASTKNRDEDTSVQAIIQPSQIVPRSIKRIDAYFRDHPGCHFTNNDFQRALEEIHFCLSVLPKEIRDAVIESHYCNLVLEDDFKPREDAMRNACKQGAALRLLDIQNVSRDAIYFRPNVEHHINRFLQFSFDKIMDIKRRDEQRTLNLHKAIFNFDLDIKSRRFWEEHIFS